MPVTPNVLDTYSRYMDQLFDEREIIGVPTVWQQFFGKPSHGGSKTIYSPDNEVVEIDIIRGNERMAALVHRGTDSRFLDMQKNTTTQNFSSFSRVYPFAEELGDISASQILKRMAGENPYDNRARIDRMRALAREHHMEHIRRYARLFEVLAGQSLLTGFMSAIIGTTNADNIYDFRRNAALTVTPAIPWNQAGADILGDIDAAFTTGREIGHVKFNVMFLGGNVAPVLLSDTTIQQFADNKGFNLVRAGENMFNLPADLSDLVNAGATAIGRITTPMGRTVYMFTYDDVVTDNAGNAQNYMPLNSVLLGYYGARCDRYFGPAERLPIVSSDVAWYTEMFGMNNIQGAEIPSNIKGGVITPDMFYCDAYPSGDKKKVTIRTQSAPIFATTQTDAFYVMNDVVTESNS